MKAVVLGNGDGGWGKDLRVLHETQLAVDGGQRENTELEMTQMLQGG